MHTSGAIWLEIPRSSQNLLLGSCPKRCFHCCYTTTFRALLVRTYKQNLHECWSCFTLCCRANTFQWLAIILAFIYWFGILIWQFLFLEAEERYRGMPVKYSLVKPAWYCYHEDKTGRISWSKKRNSGCRFYWELCSYWCYGQQLSKATFYFTVWQRYAALLLLLPFLCLFGTLNNI